MLNNNSIIDEVTPLEFYLCQNYPNPFRDKTTIKYCVAYKTRVQLSVYSTEGEEIEKLVDEEKQPGTYEVEFNTTASNPHDKAVRSLDQGYYFYRMRAGDYTSEKKWLCINKLSGKFNMKNLIQTLFFFLLVSQICFGQWLHQNSGTTKNLSAVQFIDANTGFAVGDSGTILRTTDAGNNWEIQPSETTLPLNDIFFLDENNGWILGGTSAVSIIKRTTDGGTTWYTLIEDPLFAISRLFFVDTFNGWRVGPGIFRTTDGGVSWSGGVYWEEFGDLYAKDLNTCIIVGSCPGEGRGEYPIAYATTNGGNSWYGGNLGLGNGFGYISGIYSSDATNVFAVGGVLISVYPDWIHCGVIARTTDWGVTWAAITPQGPGFSDVFFVNNLNGWVVGVNRIFRTTDGGNNWTLQLSDTLNVFSSVYFLDVSNGWAVGDNGTILHTTNGGVSFVEEEKIDEIPTEFLLSQNYPNPFNPSTRIKYQVSSISHVSLVVYDILGNEIETLVSEEKPAGTYELTWIAVNLPSGVYFYQLKAGEFIQTKKMLLLK